MYLNQHVFENFSLDGIEYLRQCISLIQSLHIYFLSISVMEMVSIIRWQYTISKLTSAALLLTMSR